MSGLLHCPLCAFTVEVKPVPKSDQLAAVFGLTGDTLQRMHLDQERSRVEDELDRHLQTHPPKVWLPALMDARRELHKARTLVTALLGETDSV